MTQNTKLPTGRPLLATLLATLTLLAFAAAPLAGAAPLEGTLIGNQASATYTDTQGTGRTTLSNIVQTQVTQIAGALVTPAGSTTLLAAPGSQVTFPMSVQNTGNGDDFFLLTAVDTLGPDYTMSSVLIYADGGGGTPVGPPITQTPTISPGSSFGFVIVAATPAGALDAQTNQINVTATSDFDGGVSDSASDITEINDDAVISVTKAITPATSGDPLDTGFTVTIQYQNTGNNTATALVLTDLLPAGMTYVAGSGRWSVTGATVLTDLNNADAQGTVPNTIIYDWNVTTANTVTAVVNQVLPGQTGEVTFQFDIPGAAAAGTVGNSIGFQYNDGSGPTAPATSNTVLFTINQAYSVTVGNDTQGPIGQGASVDFTNVITNTGNGSDSFNLSYANIDFPAGTSFQIFESDASTPFVGPTPAIAASGTYTVVLRATLPPSATGTDFDVTLTATSVGDGTVSGSGNDKLTAVTTSQVDVTNTTALPCVGCGEGVFAAGEAAAVSTLSTLPGASVSFPLFVNNTVGVPDNYDLAASTDSSFATTVLPAGWTVVFENAGGTPITNTGAIAVAGSMQVNAIVTVPAGAPAQASQSLFFRALSPVTLTADVKHDAVEVLTQRSVVLAPNNAGTAYPGGFVDYGHTLTNNGNVTENTGGATITLSLANVPATFTSAVYRDNNASGTFDAGDTPVTSPITGALAAGASINLVVRVTVPGGAALGSTGTSTLTATMAGAINAVGPPAPGSVDDVTTVAENVALVKEQAIDPLCDGTVGAYTTALLTAAPGECIHYRITATNNAAANVTAVVITDGTPTNTSYNTAGGTSPASLTPAAPITAPAPGATGSVVGTVGTLSSGASSVMTFVVRIDP